MEYYCEYNGERDYLNYLFSPAIGTNSTITKIPKGTQWILNGDLIPWKGKDPKTLFKKAFIRDIIPYPTEKGAGNPWHRINSMT